MARLRWKRAKTAFWLTMHRLWNGKTIHATVQSAHGGWFWYGHGVNTCRSPVSSEKEAKDAAMAHVRAAIKAGGSDGQQ